MLLLLLLQKESDIAHHLHCVVSRYLPLSLALETAIGHFRSQPNEKAWETIKARVDKIDINVITRQDKCHEKS
jgi:hypothetical protein